MPKQFLARLRSLFQRDQLDRDLNDELAFHVAQRTDKNRNNGMSTQKHDTPLIANSATQHKSRNARRA